MNDSFWNPDMPGQKVRATEQGDRTTREAQKPEYLAETLKTEIQQKADAGLHKLVNQLKIAISEDLRSGVGFFDKVCKRGFAFEHEGVTIGVSYEILKKDA